MHSLQDVYLKQCLRLIDYLAILAVRMFIIRDVIIAVCFQYGVVKDRQLVAGECNAFSEGCWKECRIER